MKNISLNLSNKLLPQDEKLLKLIDDSLLGVQIPYVLVGAKARDILMEHVYNIKCPRATLDTDIGVLVENWERFHDAKNIIQTKGDFQHNSKTPHRLASSQYGVIDIVPFGEIENQNEISWPPDYSTTMNLVGFKEAFDNAVTINVNQSTQINISSLASLCMLKIIAWKDRAYMSKDAEDIAFIALNYLQAGNQSRLFDDFEYLLTDDFDYTFAGAYILGYDIAKQASAACHQEISQILKNEIEANLSSGLVSGFVRHTSKQENTYDFSRRLLQEINKGVLSKLD